jgi:hypothetical protein
MSTVGYNVTVEPSAFATPVDAPEITEIIDLRVGQIVNSRQFIARHRYDELIATRVEMREALKRQVPSHTCPICGIPVYLVASPNKRFFFRHLSEDGSCPAITRSELTEDQIRARKYHGLKESEAHKRIKRLIERSLRADPSFETETIAQEKRWKAAHDPSKWRKPDVQASSSEGRFAFEAQLSTTFLDVVVSRRVFYQSEGALLVWVLGYFTPDYRRMTTDDLLFSNNSNIFVVDDETVSVSERNSRFHLRCFYRRPQFLDGKRSEDWHEAIVAFSELTKELGRQRIFHFDFDAANERLALLDDQKLRDEFVAFWMDDLSARYETRPERIAQWRELRKQFEGRRIEIPAYPTEDGSFRTMMLGMLSAREGRAVGWQFGPLIQAAHQLAQGHPENLMSFGYALDQFDHKKTIIDQDKSGKWERRCERNRERIRNRDPAILPRTDWLPALSFLFPEVGRRVQAFVDRLDPIQQQRMLDEANNRKLKRKERNDR